MQFKKRLFYRNLFFIILSVCTLSHAQTTLFPYIEMGAHYDDYVYSESDGLYKSAHAINSIIGASIVHSFTQNLTGTITGFSNLDHFLDPSINTAGYQYANNSIKFSPTNKLTISLNNSYLHYTPSYRNYQFDRYSIKPILNYQLTHQHSIKLYFNRDTDVYRYHKNNHQESYFFRYTHTGDQHAVYPYLNYTTDTNYVEWKYGIGIFNVLYNKHSLTSTISLINRIYSKNYLDLYSISSDIEHAYAINYSYLMTKSLTFNLNTLYLHTKKKIIANSSMSTNRTNFNVALSISWSPIWTLKQFKPSSDDLFNKANDLYKKQKYKQAINIITQSLKKNPAHWESYYLLSYAYIQSGQLEKALPYLLLINKEMQDPKIYGLIQYVKNKLRTKNPIPFPGFY